MELKAYQRDILKEVGRYARIYARTGDAANAYGIYLNAIGLTPGKDGVSPYHDDLGGVPKVCVKVPTGGGKTFIGASAIDVLSEALPSHDEVVVWLVPRKEILAQTLRCFRNPGHFLRIKLDQDFAGRVEVLDKEDGLRGRNFNASTVGDQLTLFVLSYDSFKNKDGRRAFAENSSLASLTAWQRDVGTSVNVEGADDTALISALAGTNPIVIVDESHHAGSKLSLDMLRNLNPRFVLELTATPDPKRANVIAQATARELKREEMVKLPVVVYRRQDKRAVLADAVTLQRRLEAIAEQDEKRTGRYIRPIVLFQAERRGPDAAETYAKLKEKLVEAGVPAEQIAVRTGDVDELGDADLMSRKCSVRFIITVEALSEGWDCPFAYVLATVANKNSQVSVEQIVGRVLRQPHAARAGVRSLNIAYVLTASADFDATLTQVVDGLNGVGFSREDVEAAGDAVQAPDDTQARLDLAGAGSSSQDESNDRPTGDDSADANDGTDDLDGIDLSELADMNDNGDTTNSTAVDDILDGSEAIEEKFEHAAEADDGARGLLGGLGGGANVHCMREEAAKTARDLLLPQFYIRVDGGLFTDDECWKPLDREDLLTDFKLERYGIDRVRIDPANFSEARAIDLMEDSDEYKIRWLQARDREQMRMLFRNMSDAGKRESLKAAALGAMSGQFKNLFGDTQLASYISRVVESLESPEVEDCFDSVGSFAKAIQDAVRGLAGEFSEDRFEKLLAAGTVELREAYRFPISFVQPRPMTSYGKSLYEAEDGNIDGDERAMVDLLANSPRILWWHRDVERRHGEFSINGFINHYPDFLALRDDGVLMAIETKGGHLKGDDTKNKLALGTRWADMAGRDFRYFMVFANEALDMTNSFTIAEFSREILGC